MSSFEMSAAKHKAESARRRQNVRQDRPDMDLRPRRQICIRASTSDEFVAAGGVIEIVPSTYSAPTRYPQPKFVRGQGSQG